MLRNRNQFFPKKFTEYMCFQKICVRKFLVKFIWRKKGKFIKRYYHFGCEFSFVWFLFESMANLKCFALSCHSVFIFSSTTTLACIARDTQLIYEPVILENIVCAWMETEELVQFSFEKTNLDGKQAHI